MKNHFLLTRFLTAGLLLAVTAGCDLKLQKEFEFKPEAVVAGTVKHLTAWEWLQTQTTPIGTTPVNTEKFDYMIQAIQVAGMEAEYSGTYPNRTFLLLNNTAFTQLNGILQVITGSRTGNLATLTSANLERLKKVLRYHIVTTYIDQIPTLYTFGTEYFFQTLVEGPNGQISFRRDERYNITINGSAQLPSTKKSTTVYRYNYVFKYGIAHLMTTYVGIVAF
jgi:uncharacterized surface protein with fasciclin (FAS1) repeats